MPKKCCDPDPIPSPLFLDCLDELMPVIRDIINTSLISGAVPQCFKHALVKPLLKKSNLDPELLKNYHLVSNLPFLSKVLERVVLTQLMTHLETHNLLEPFQSAYRKCHSTETALLCVVNDLLLMMVTCLSCHCSTFRQHLTQQTMSFWVSSCPLLSAVLELFLVGLSLTYQIAHSLSLWMMFSPLHQSWSMVCLRVWSLDQFCSPCTPSPWALLSSS